MSIIFNMKNDLILIPNDAKNIKKEIVTDQYWFSLISKTFRDHINCETFDKFANKKIDGSIEYTVDTTYEVLNWVINIYYVKESKLICDNELIKKLDKLFILKVYNFAVDMEIAYLQNTIETYITYDMIAEYVMGMARFLSYLYGDIENKDTKLNVYTFINKSIRKTNFIEKMIPLIDREIVSIYHNKKNSIIKDAYYSKKNCGCKNLCSCYVNKLTETEFITKYATDIKDIKSHFKKLLSLMKEYKGAEYVCNLLDELI